MLARAGYRVAWEKKLAWYRANGIHPVGEGDNSDTVLVTTTDSANSGLDMREVNKLVVKVCGG